MASLGEELYTGGSSFGKFMALISAVVASVISLGLLAFGIYVLVKKDPHTASANALVKTATCMATPSGEYECYLGVLFYPDRVSTPVIANITFSSRVAYVEGQHLTIYYDPSNPTSISIKKMNPKILGWGSIVAAVVISASAWFWYWVVYHYKFAAAAYGFGQGLGIRSII
jgi:hypothetical protein